MFKRKSKKHNGLPEDLQEFLEEADRLFIKAFETRSISVMKDYFTRECCFTISRWIVAEASSRYFGQEKFRETTWTILEQTPTKYVLEKTCVYKDIRISLSRTMKVSDDYREQWSINVTPEEYWVTDVHALPLMG